MTIPSQNGPESDSNEGVLHIPQSSNINGTSQLDCLVSYPGHLLGGFYPTAEKQSVYSTAPADRVTVVFWLVNTSSSNNKTNHDM